MERLDLQPQLAERVYRSVLDAVCDGRLAPGERVTQEHLAELFGVSRQPIQQALLLLKKQGFITEAGRKGVMVAPLDPGFVADLYKVRGALEALASREAAARRPAWLRDRATAIIAQGRAAAAAQSPAELIAADMAFHALLYEASGNPLIAEATALHWHHIRRVMGAVLQDAGALRPVWDEHAAILDAVLAGDEERAERLARLHMDNASTTLIARLSASNHDKRKTA